MTTSEETIEKLVDEAYTLPLPASPDDFGGNLAVAIKGLQRLAFIKGARAVLALQRDVSVIKNFLTKMATQDNRGTAHPFFYVIRTKVAHPAPLDNCDEVKWYWDDHSYDTLEEAEAAIKDSGLREEPNEYGVKYHWEHRGMFLTEDDAETHLKLNHYHYSPDAYTYVEHAWRAPELTKFLKALFEHFEIEVKR